MEALQEEEKKIHTQSRKRIQHLECLYKIPSLVDVKYDEWSRVRLNRLLVDHMLRSGFSESAKQLAAEKGIEDLADLNVFIQCQRIAESLRKGETKEALQWCAENKVALKKSQVCCLPIFCILTVYYILPCFLAPVMVIYAYDKKLTRM
jgi:macrophage erythroblast attacher